ncbi:HAMP domain-containing protein [Paenibacillus taichungensis]|uniref:HAMP domain-containing protein n=1 Tax=Paenibacillus taichungensis TaxID=484184 RepID=UPI0039A4C853
MVGSVISLAYSEYYELRNNYILIIAVTLIFVMAAAYWIATLFIKPLKSLGATSRLMSSDDFTGRVQIKGKDEFAELGAAFNQMSAQLSLLLKRVASSANRVQSISVRWKSIPTIPNVLPIRSPSQEMSNSVGGINRNVEQSVTMIEKQGKPCLPDCKPWIIR